MIKKAELQVLKKYNQFSAIFAGSAMTVCILQARNTKLSMVARIAPAVVLIPFIGFFYKNIGMYGVH